MTDIDEVKNRLDIVDVLGGYIQLKKAGANYKAVCPFHEEKTPSFMLSPEKQIWHCFGCGRGGDIFGFVMEYEKLTFPEALEMLAKKAGVELKDRKSFGPSADRKEELMRIIEEAAKFFQSQLMDTPEGRNATRYLLDRGLKNETIKAFGLGYAPKSWEAAIRYLQKKGFSNPVIRDAGIAVEKNGKLIDKFVDRITFPIADHMGRLVGFTARTTLPGVEPKYLNSPDTPVFSKGRLLYGLGQNREYIKSADWVVMVEGQMDMISLWQAGIKNVVATSGTALTADQLRLLGRYTKKLVLAFDRDAAGEQAAKKALPLLEQADFVAKIAVYEGSDPDESVRKSKAAFAQVLKTAPLVIDHFLEEGVKKYLEAPSSRKKESLSEILQVISQVAEPVAQEEYIKKVSNQLGVNTSTLADSLRQSLSEVRETVRQETVPNEKRSLSLLSRLCALMMTYPQVAAKVDLPDSGDLPEGDGLLDIYKKLKSEYTQNTFSTKDFLNTLDTEAATALAESIFVIQHETDELTEAGLTKEITQLVTELIRQRIAQLEQFIAQAQLARNIDKENELLQTIVNLQHFRK